MRQVQTNKAFQSLQILQMPGKFVTYIFASFQQIVLKLGEATFCRVFFPAELTDFC